MDTSSIEAKLLKNSVEEQHYKDLCELDDMIADCQQLANFAIKTAEKLRKVHYEILNRIGQIEVQIPRDTVL